MDDKDIEWDVNISGIVENDDEMFLEEVVVVVILCFLVCCIFLFNSMLRNDCNGVYSNLYYIEVWWSIDNREEDLFLEENFWW